MTLKKALPDDIDNFFEGESVFFQKPEADAKPQSPTPIQEESETSSLPASVPTTEEGIALERKSVSNQSSPTPSLDKANTDVMIDVMMSALQDVNLRAWREVIENTETQNTALRITSEERYAIEDVVNELRRKEKVKTSMNEIARLGLIYLIYDFKKNGHESILYKVKKT